MNQTMPPAWAEEVLRLLLPPKDRDSVRGDLLEEYREEIAPTRGVLRADLWYAKQVAGFAWRSAVPWALLFAAIFVLRTPIDALLPTRDFTVRAVVSTMLVFMAWFGCGIGVAWRTGLARSGALAGIAMAVIAPFIAGVLNAVFVLALTYLRNEWAIANLERAGGITEVFLLPLVVTGPGMLMAGLGGLLGAVARRLSSRSKRRTSS